MPIGDNSHLIVSVSVGTGIPLLLPNGAVELLAPRPERVGGCLWGGPALEAARTAVSYNQGGLFIQGLQEP